MTPKQMKRIQTEANARVCRELLGLVRKLHIETHGEDDVVIDLLDAATAALPK